MKFIHKTTPLTFILIIFLAWPVWAFAKEPAHPLFAPGETTEWMGTYFKGKKLGFTFARMQVSDDGITVDSKVFFRLKAGGANQSTTFSQNTNLNPDLSLKDFSLVQVIMGSRQKVDAHIKNGKLIYRVTGLGFDKTKTIPFSPNMAPASTFLLNIIKDGLVIGKKGKVPIFMEPFQMLMDVEYNVLRKEPFEYQGKSVDTFVVFHRVAGMESTLWVTADGSVMREMTSQGFESRKEPEHIATDLGEEAMTVSSLITLSLVKPGKIISRPGKKRQMKMKLSKMRSPDLIPQDHRQKVLQSEKSADGTYASVLLVNAEPQKVRQPVLRPVSSFSQPEYLEDSAEVQSKHPQIRSLAKELVGDTQDAWKASQKINEWVFRNLEKVLVDSASALNALKERRGECQSHTYLFTAIARAAGIPTKIVNGLVYSPKYQGFLYHAWPEVYVGEWRALDPTFGQSLVDATHIKLSEGQKDDQFKLMEFVGKVQIELLEN
ncbi:MAG: transglutaminase [Nitrospinaceae bacterium]|nr:MAG: transglutaminase [Nitrospinaceae bacterium]